MAETVKKRIYRLDGDALEINFYYNAEFDKYFGDYPDFSEEPRFTPSERPWVNAIKTDCIYSKDMYDDCGSCEYFLREKHNDLIGICLNVANKKQKGKESDYEK